MATNPFAPHNEGQAFSGELNIDTVRRIDKALARGEDNKPTMLADVEAFANEARLYQLIINGPNGQHGWKTHRKPLHRLAEINHPLVDVIEQKAAEYPLTCRILEYGEGRQVRWAQFRHPAQLSEDELYSDPKYLALYDEAAERGECSPRIPRKADPGAEPAPDDRLELAAQVMDAMNGITYDLTTYPLRRQLGCLITGLRNFSLPVYEAIDLAWTGHRSEDAIETGRRLEQLSEQVPALQPLVEWIKTRKEAA